MLLQFFILRATTFSADFVCVHNVRAFFYVMWLIIHLHSRISGYILIFIHMSFYTIQMTRFLFPKHYLNYCHQTTGSFHVIVS